MRASVHDYGLMQSRYDAEGQSIWTKLRTRKVRPTQSRIAKAIRDSHDISKGRFPLRTITLCECTVVWAEADGEKYLTLLPKRWFKRDIPILVMSSADPDGPSRRIQLPFGRVVIDEKELEAAGSGTDRSLSVIGAAINKAVSEYLDEMALQALTPNSPEEELHVAIEQGNLEQVRILNSNGVSANAEFQAGWRPLMFSVAQGEVQVARYLLEKGAMPDAANLHGRTALHFAAKYGNRELCRLLVEFGASLDLQEVTHGGTPLMGAAMNGHNSCVTFLMEKGARADIKTHEGQTAESLARLNGYGTTARIISRTARRRGREPDTTDQPDTT